MASQQPWSTSQQSSVSLDEQLSATQPFEDSQSYSQGYSQDSDGDNDDDECAADTKVLSQASNAETVPYEMSQSLSQRLSDVEEDDEDEDSGPNSPILGDDVSDDDAVLRRRASQSLSPSPPPKAPWRRTPIPAHGYTTARSPSACRSGSDTPASAPGTSSPPLSADSSANDPTPVRQLHRKDSNGAKAATAALGPRGPFALAAAAAARARSRGVSQSPSVGTSPVVVKPCAIKAGSRTAKPAVKPKSKPAPRRVSSRSKQKTAAGAGAASETESSVTNSTADSSSFTPSVVSSASAQGTLDNFLVRKKKPPGQPPLGSRLLQPSVETGIMQGAASQPDTPPPQSTEVDGGQSGDGASTSGSEALAAAITGTLAATNPATKRTRDETTVRSPALKSSKVARSGVAAVAANGRSRKTAKAACLQGGYKAPRRLSEVQQLQQLQPQQHIQTVSGCAETMPKTTSKAGSHGNKPKCKGAGGDASATSPATKRRRRSNRR